MRHYRAAEQGLLAAELSATYAAIYRHCHPPYTAAIGHQSVRALQLVAENGASVGSIAQHLACASNTASELVQRLLKLELVSKHRGGRDGDERAVDVRLTSKGERVLLEQTGLDISKLGDRLEALASEDRKIIQNGLQLLLDCVSRP